MKKNIIIIGALLAALLFAGCADVLNPPETADSGGAAGKLAVLIGGEGRTLAPAAGELAGLSYNLYISNSNTGEVLAYNNVNTANPIEYTLAAGSWELNAQALNAAGDVVAEAEEDFYIVKGETTPVKLTMTPVSDTDVAGTFSFNIKYPEDIVNVGSSIVSLSPSTPNSGDFVVDLTKAVEAEGVCTISGDQALPPGEYYLTIQLGSDRYISGENLIVNRIEVVYIYPGMKTNAVFAFTEADFTADVVLAGTAVVYKADNITVDSNYIPDEVYVFNDNWEVVKKGSITFNAEDDVYEWEVMLPSHDVRDYLNSVNVNFRATHKDDSTKTINSPMRDSTVNIAGNTNINLTARLATLSLGSIMPDPQTITSAADRATFEFNADVARGGYTEVKITNPKNYGLISDGISLNNNLYGDDVINSIKSENGVITLGLNLPNTGTMTLGAAFFHLKGTMYVNTTTEGYAPDKIEAFEPAEDDEDPPISIGAIKPTLQTSSTTSYDWVIPIPAGYVWKNTTSSPVSLVTTLKATGQPDQVQENTDFLNNLIDVNAAINDTITLFTIENVAAIPVSTDTIRITWDAVEWAAGGYKVYLAGASDELIATINTTATDFYDYTSNTLTAGQDYGFYVVGRKSATVDGNQSINAWGRVKQPQPAFYTSYEDTSTGFLSAVYLSWDPVATGNGYIIERSTDYGNNWQQVYSTYSYSTTSWTDNSYELPPVNATINYRITVRDTSYNAANSEAKDLNSAVYAPSAQNISWNNLYWGSLVNSGEKKVYVLPDNSPYQAYFIGSDIDNNLYGGESVDARFRVYSYNNKSEISNWDSTNGSSFYASYDRLLIVVEGYNSTNTGDYAFMVGN